MDTYEARFYNEQGEEWEFTFEYNSLAAYLSGSAIDWALIEVVNGKVSGIELFPNEKKWLQQEWYKARKKIPKGEKASLERGWSTNDIKDILANPMYAGIGPFNTIVDNEVVEIPEIPKIIDDESFVKVQIRRIEELGPKLAIQQLRGTLHKYLGFRLTSISHEGWLEDSIKFIESNGTEDFFYTFLALLRPKASNPLELARTKVFFKDITPLLFRELVTKPEELFHISPEIFEQLICERLDKMGFGLERVGINALRKDGGIDIVAWPLKSPFPFLMAVQAKHRRSPKNKTGPDEVRDLFGVVQNFNFNVGVLVTNTTFTPDARWFARQRSNLLRLRDITDIQLWLQGQYLDNLELRDTPSELEVCPGVTIKIPRYR